MIDRDRDIHTGRQRQTDRGRDGQGQTDIKCGQTERQRQKTDTTMGSKDRNIHRRCRHADRYSSITDTFYCTELMQPGAFKA